MHPFSIPGSSRSRRRIAWLLSLAALGWTASFVGCGGSSGGGGTGGKTDAGNNDARDAGTGGRGGSGTGGMGTGGSEIDSGTDAINVCADADAGADAGGPGDFDSDGIPDCLDGCPFDIAKSAPGQCGCGTPETGDFDGDGFADCVDQCPKEPARHTAGLCGCLGIPDTTPLCLVHRYSFNDTTATITDSVTIAGVSPANGTAQGTAVPSGGRITLAGGPGNQATPQYVSLPAGTVSKVGINATFEAWVTWNPVAPNNGPWQRVFDFGSSNLGAGAAGIGQTYLFMSPLNGGNQRARAAITLTSNSGEDLTDVTAALPTGRLVHVAVVVDGTHQVMTLYVDGTTSTATVMLRASGWLSLLDDVNNWLGRSQWVADQLFPGSIDEFRIYSRALSQAEISASFAAGPDGTVPPPPVDGGTGDGAATPDADAGDVPVDSGGGVDAGVDVVGADAGADGGGDVPVGG
ncbi:MAG TPA: LamG domain-containing protein [Polyangia bacterium]|nr:LamG domain-containing protein [Polyangia bacterium]